MSTFKKIEKNDTDLSLGSFLRQKRLESGLTLEEVSRYLQVSVVVTRYEENKKDIPMHHIYALSNCLNVPADLILKTLVSFS
jgi:transcriptional regulator with XRE-family HTH domain